MMGGAAVSVALPFLDCFLDGNGAALAATGAKLPTVFGTWFWGCGLNPNRWMPEKTGTGYDMVGELKPLQPYRDHISIISGLKVFTDGKAAKPHYTGDMGVLTGDVPRGVMTMPSVDQIIADTIGTSSRFRSIEVTATGNPSHSLSMRGGTVVNPAEASPVALYQRLFGADFKDPNSADFTPDPKVMVRKSVLTAVSDQRQAFTRDLGAADKARLDEYFTSLRQLEQQLEIQLQKPAPMEACAVPKQPGETTVGLDIEQVMTNHKLMAQLIAHAVACGQTRVFNVVFSDAQSTMRRAGSVTTHHILTHEEQIDRELGYQPQATWFIDRSVENLAYFINTMLSVKEGDGTLLDRMAVFANSETGYAKIHSLENIPAMVIGRAGGRLKSGVHVTAQGDPASRVGFTLQQVMGVPVDSWGTESMKTSKAISEILV
jgi:hypothetical protein